GYLLSPVGGASVDGACQWIRCTPRSLRTRSSSTFEERIMKRLLVSVSLTFLSLASCATSHASTEPSTHVAHAAHPTAVSAGTALDILSQGNQRYVSGHLQHPRQTPERRAELANGQVPSAVVIGCSDSRTAPEV